MDIVYLDPDVPVEDILKEVSGDISAALRLAASFGYKSACRDLDKVALSAIKEAAK